MLQSYSSKYNEFLTRQIHHTQRGASLPPLWSGDLIVSSQEDCVIDGKAVKTLICTVWQHECAP